MILDDRAELASGFVACYQPQGSAQFLDAWDLTVAALIETQNTKELARMLQHPIESHSHFRFLERSVLRAARRNDLSTLNTLLDLGGKPTAFESISVGYTQVTNNAGGVSISSAFGASPAEGFNALFYAISHDNVEMVRSLIDHGADPSKNILVSCAGEWRSFLAETERARCSGKTIMYGEPLLDHAKARSNPRIIEIVESAIASRKRE